eukprot:CAMPEP_0201493232 /NCGR_PEP_ID=MMETSP0151_2-20130828/36470_1 /ASSEMBLY_ACC=CAM_ASM_000257 /TAXON_ID=200890 /ORGANISM="Paramoeba atlantica, Strain 621/1 / CCAP 1560/9" /LENGTH=98 /DNA_ID=CAMNT_0047880465 /DNA_START=107 /DNA_END=403 /DNA_ORIENTATION=-
MVQDMKQKPVEHAHHNMDQHHMTKEGVSLKEKGCDMPLPFQDLPWEVEDDSPLGVHASTFSEGFQGAKLELIQGNLGLAVSCKFTKSTNSLALWVLDD